MIKRVEHVGIIAADMNESINFYENLLGFQLRQRIKHEERELAFLTHPGLPGFELELLEDHNNKYCDKGLVNHLAFVVDDLEKVMQVFMEKGVVFLTKTPKQRIGRKTNRFKGINDEIL